jgi:hypothetical protein
VQLDAFHLPAGFSDAPRETVIEQDGVAAVSVRLPPNRIRELCQALVAARHALMTEPLSRTIDAIDAAARSLLDPAGAARGDVLRGLSAFTGLSAPMAEHVLDRVAADWLAPAMQRLVTAELGGAEAIEDFIVRPDGSRSRAVAPPLGLHVFSGNVPGVSVTSMVRALLVRSAVIGKPAAGEPVLAPAFARLLADVDPLVGACCAVIYWPGGDTDTEAAVLAHAELVVHYGGEQAIESLRARAAPDTRFVEHGPRVSFAVVSADAAPDAAVDLATAVALFDQQGCVSPQSAYVVGEPQDALAFAARVAAELDRIARSMPRGRLTAAESAAIHDFRTRAEFRAIAGGDVHLWIGPALSYTVIYDDDPTFSGTCLNRTLTIRSVASVQQLLSLVSPAARFLQTVGIAGFEPPEVRALAAALGEMGATRVAPIAAMPWPPATWHHDGRGPLLELVRWVDLET